jgi:hypothetical protein
MVGIDILGENYCKQAFDLKCSLRVQMMSSSAGTGAGIRDYARLEGRIEVRQVGARNSTGSTRMVSPPGSGNITRSKSLASRSPFQACQTRDNEACSKLILLHCGGEYGFSGTSSPAGTPSLSLEHSTSQAYWEFALIWTQFCFCYEIRTRVCERLGPDQRLSHCGGALQRGTEGREL